MKWIKSTLFCVCYTKVNLFFYSPQLWAKKIGKPCNTEDARTLHVKYVCKNHFWRQTSQCLKGNDWTEGQWHVAQTRLHKIQHDSFLIPHSQIWIHYPQFFLSRRAFMSSYPREPMASCLYPQPLFRHLFLSMKTVHALPLKSAIKSTPPAGSMFEVEDISCPLTLNPSSDGEILSLQSGNTF